LIVPAGVAAGALVVFSGRGVAPAGTASPTEYLARRLAHAAGEPDIPIVRATQVHGASAAAVREAPGSGACVDAGEHDVLATTLPGVALVVQTADCVPILLRASGAVAAAHAGWRGLSVRVPAAAVAALGREFASQRKDLVAAIGPAIGACCYEVGADVFQRFVRTGFTGDQIGRWFLPRPAPSARNATLPSLPAPREDHWYFDAWASAREQLEAVGIPPGQIFVAELCTASHPEWLCSYRRDGSPAGRMAGAIRSPRRRP
jgi:YfiH family protein